MTDLVRDPADADDVSWLELFFDLVFVFAVSQLSRHLVQHPTWAGAAQTVVLLVAIYVVWVQTPWAATLLRTDRAQ